VLYELLAGRRPFDRANDLETLKAIAHATPAPLPDGVPEALRIAVDKALEKEPADRYQTMRELVVDLRRVVRKSGSSQTALAPSDAQIVAGVFRRNPIVTLAAAAAIVLAVGAATYFGFGPASGPPALPVTSYEQLTTTGTVTSPALSPNGQFVVYTQIDSGAIPTSLWIRQIANGRSIPIVEPKDGVFVLGPTVTLDSAYVYFIRQEPSRQAFQELWRASLLGGGPQPIADGVWGPVGFAPDRLRMAFLRFDSAKISWLLVVADLDGSNENVLAEREDPEWFPGMPNLVRPAWSPDGKTIAMFELAQGRGARVAFIDVKSRRVKMVHDARAAGAVNGLAWLGPTSLVLSQAEANLGRAQLWQMSYRDGAVTPLTNDLSSYIGVDVDAQRRNLVTVRQEMRVTVSVGDVAGAGAVDVSPQPTLSYGRITTKVVWGGERLIFDSSANGRLTIAATPVGGGTPEDLATGAYSPAVTSDGNTVVFMRDGSPGLWRVDGRGGGLRQVVERDARDPTILADDRTVLFLSSRSGTQSLWSVPIAGGEPMPVVDDFVSEFDVSGDGRRLLFGTVGQSIVVCDLPLCVNRQTPGWPDDALVGLRLTSDGEGITYIAHDQNIWSRPLGGGEPRQLTAFSETLGAGIVGYSWSRDGTKLAVSRRETSINDIVLLSNLQP